MRVTYSSLFKWRKLYPFKVPMLLFCKNISVVSGAKPTKSALVRPGNIYELAFNENMEMEFVVLALEFAIM